LVAAIVDGVIVFVVSFLLGAILGTVGRGLGIIVSIGYYTFFEGSPSGQTPGKRLMNIRVVDFQTGGPLGYGRAALRWVARIISSIPCLLGYFWMLWDKEKQTWHDKIANDVVVPTSAYPVTSWPG
jgi:uncharacterized RDD family membrane protein YckC